MNSGISTIAREIVIGTANKYKWSVLGAAINHPEAGQRLDLSADTDKFAGIEGSEVILYPNNGYGDIDLLRNLIKIEKPDALMIFTDPRYFIWLFHMEDEIRTKIPIIYYTIWDSAPAPLWNKSYYDSCDALMCISKQTKNLVELVLEEQAKEKVISYVPHGLNHNVFYPIPEGDTEYLQFKNQILGNKEYDFVVFWNSRNIHRKHPSDIILAFSEFIKGLPTEQAQRCALVMHTNPIDENGTDLNAVKEALCDDNCTVIFSDVILPPKNMNYLYNLADVTVSMSSNEGWGLSLTESLLAGTMIMANVQGGMQDQMRFRNALGEWIKFDETFLSNHYGTYPECGEWAKPIFPSNFSLAGSVPTPYIFDERADFRDLRDNLRDLYNEKMLCSSHKNILKVHGMKGREWAIGEAQFTAENMCKGIEESIDKTLQNFKPKIRYTLTKVENIKTKKIKHPIIY